MGKVILNEVKHTTYEQQLNISDCDNELLCTFLVICLERSTHTVAVASVQFTFKRYCGLLPACIHSKTRLVVILGTTTKSCNTPMHLLMSYQSFSTLLGFHTLQHTRQNTNT